MSAPVEDWASVIDRLLKGDRLALVKVSRLLNSFLVRWRAYDFPGDWEDLIQEVTLATALAVRDGKIRERAALYGYLRSTLRFKYIARLKLHLRQRGDDTLPWDDRVAGSVETDTPREETPGLRGDLERALSELSENQREAVVRVYVEGLTYPEAAKSTGIPLGSLKRYLRDGLARLREELGENFLDV